MQPPAAWELSVWSCDNLELELGEETRATASVGNRPVLWTKLLTLGQETINTPLFAQLDHAELFLVTDQLKTYVLAGRPSGDPPGASKRLRLAVYADSGATCGLRVYALEDTSAAAKAAADREARLGGCLLDKPRSLPFEASGAPLEVRLEEVGNEWAGKSPSERRQLGFDELWRGHEGLRLVSFELGAGANCPLTRTYKLQVSQVDAEGHRQVFRVIHDGAKQVVSSGSVTRPLREVTVVSSGTDSKTLRPFRFTRSLRKQLCQCLDPPNSLGNDWRMLAQMLRVDR